MDKRYAVFALAETHFDEALYDAAAYAEEIGASGMIGHQFGELVNSEGKSPVDGDALWTSDGKGGAITPLLDAASRPVIWRPEKYALGSTPHAIAYARAIDAEFPLPDFSDDWTWVASLCLARFDGAKGARSRT